jgi:hypothetical protein
MITKFKLFEQLDYEEEEEEDDSKNLADPDVVVKKGDKVICIKDCINFHIDGESIPDKFIRIRRGEIKIIDGGTIICQQRYEKEGVFFTDTPCGEGVYPIENFDKYD